ncbi:MAG: hypothetical protein H0V44_17435 [Planctomycetes bacterium]|nr:hypothetical protein [Planctomycetota bacterium]
MASTVDLALLGALYGEKIKEIATWGQPVMTEGFDDAAWSTRWKDHYGSFEFRDGRAVSTSPKDSLLIYRQRFEGDCAVELDAEILDGSHLGDLSIFWARDLDRH